MIIEKLSVLDIESILQLESDFSDGWSYNQLKSAFDGNRFFVLGITENGKLIAFVSYSVAIDQADIETVLVSKQHRRKGLAKTLIESAELELKAIGVQKVFLEVRENNMPARSLYNRLGYLDISTRKSYYFDGENATVMAKELL